MAFFADVRLGLAVSKTTLQGEEAARKWLRTTGFENIDELNKVLQKTATLGKKELKIC